MRCNWRECYSSVSDVSARITGLQNGGGVWDSVGIGRSGQ